MYMDAAPVLMGRSDGDVPVANRPETIYGSSITVQLVAVLAVALRLVARFRMSHGLGLDDLFVVLACIATTLGTTFVCLQPGAGLGKHQSSLDMAQFSTFVKWTFFSMLGYASSTALIKISILFQYARIIDKSHRIFRIACFVMTGLVSIWGLFFFFGLLFSCSPPSTYWLVLNRTNCVLFASTNRTVQMATYVGQASTNMVLDITVFAMPLYLLKNQNASASLGQKNKLGLLGVFCLGAIVIIISILRLDSIRRHKLGFYSDPMDVTFYSAATIIWSCVEVNVAVLTASIPTFWPMISDLAFGKILVTQEVEVRSEDQVVSRGFSRMGDTRSEDEEELTLSTSWGKSYAKSYADPPLKKISSLT